VEIPSAIQEGAGTFVGHRVKLGVDTTRQKPSRHFSANNMNQPRIEHLLLLLFVLAAVELSVSAQEQEQLEFGACPIFALLPFSSSRCVSLNQNVVFWFVVGCLIKPY